MVGSVGEYSCLNSYPNSLDQNCEGKNLVAHRHTIPQNKVVVLGKGFSKCELKSIILAPFFIQRVILEVVLR